MRKLSSKLTAVLAALLVGVLSVCVGVSLHVTRSGLQSVDQTLHASLANEVLASYLPVLRESFARGLELPLFDQLMAINPNSEFYLLDPDGRVLRHRAPVGRVSLEQVSIVPVEAFLARSQPLPILGDDPRDPATPKAFSAARIEIDGQHKGYLYAVLGGDAYRTAAAMFQASSALRVTLVVLVGALVVALGLGAFAFRLLSGRLARLSNEMLAFESTGFRASMAVVPTTRGGDEIDDLSRVYAALASRVAQQFAELERMDRSRRELLSHLSHDLRTPLATLQAYLETLTIKGSTLPPDTRDEYLAAAVQFSRKIDAMTADLFELATLDMHEAPMRPEDFFVAELLHDIGQRFGLQAGGKGVKLEIVSQAPGPQISADIGLIERLFANLIDNALKFTPPGGNIKVSVREMGPTVVIDVTDTGIGIPEHDLGRIFESFQRATHETATDGTGLGLAIAKRISNLHGGRISVESTLGKGTSFRVELPRVKPAV
jgi:two-component system, OmpR family, sensor kinase